MRTSPATWLRIDTPELTNAQLAEAEIYEGDNFICRVGRPKGSGTKDLVTLRLDRPCSTISAPADRAGKPASTML
jgi:hypothetical protein